MCAWTVVFLEMIQDGYIDRIQLDKEIPAIIHDEYLDRLTLCIHHMHYIEIGVCATELL